MEMVNHVGRGMGGRVGGDRAASSGARGEEGGGLEGMVRKFLTGEIVAVRKNSLVLISTSETRGEIEDEFGVGAGE